MGNINIVEINTKCSKQYGC